MLLMTDEISCSRHDVATIFDLPNDTNTRASWTLGESLVCFSFDEVSSSCDLNFRAAAMVSLAVVGTVALSHDRFMKRL